MRESGMAAPDSFVVQHFRQQCCRADKRWTVRADGAELASRERVKSGIQTRLQRVSLAMSRAHMRRTIWPYPDVVGLRRQWQREVLVRCYNIDLAEILELDPT